MSRSALYIFCAILPVLSCGLTAVNAQKLVLTSYTARDGLVNNEVRRIFQDSKGLMWFGTSNGFSIYDGHAFTSYSTREGLSKPVINDFCELPDGSVWVATNSASNYICKHFRLEPLSGRTAQPQVRQFYSTTGHQYLIAGQDGFWEFRNGSPLRLTPGNATRNTDISCMLPCNDSLLLLASVGSAYIRLIDRNKGYAVIDSVNGLQTTDMMQDHTGRIWIATRHEGIKWMPSGILPGRRLHPVPAPHPLDFPQLADANCFIEDNHHNIWIGTEEQGLFKYTPEGRLSWYCTGYEGGINTVRCLFKDREDNLWLGTTHGVCKISDEDMECFDMSQGMSADESYAIMENKATRTVWAAAAHGLTILAPDVRQSVRKASFGGRRLKDDDEVHCFLKDQGFLWVAWYDHRLNQNELIKVREGEDPYSHRIPQRILDIPGPPIRSMAKDAHGNIYLCGSGGLSVIHGGKVRSLGFREKIHSPGFREPDAPGVLLIDRQGDCWIGTTGQGLY